jgi:large subunit ribosomal protein L21
MYAVIKTGGKQYRVSPGDEVKVEKLEGEPGAKITFDQVLLTSDDGKVKIGQPYVNKSKVVGRILRQDKNKKVLILKYKRRKGFRRKQGHRQNTTLVKIESIKS